MNRAGRTLGNWVTDTVVLAIALAFGVLSWIVPKRRGIVACYPSFEPRRFAGNLRPVFERLSAGPPGDVTPVWLARSSAVAADLRDRGLNVAFSRGRPLWSLLRADLILIDSTEPRIGFGRFRFVQLWHGSGIKRIGLEKEGRTPMRRWALRAHFRRYVLIAAASEADRARKAECFANEAVALLGSPRIDALVAGADFGLAERLGYAADRRIVAYCPTYREGRGAAPFTLDGWRRLDRLMVEQGAVCLVKRHFRDGSLAVPPGLAAVHDVTAEVDDVQALLAATAVLITDYSSISTDFALTGRPLVFFTYDAAAFMVDGRGLYASLLELLPGPFAADEDRLLALLSDGGWFDEPAYRAAYDRFRSFFNAHADAAATDRVLAALVPLLRPAAA